jgi:hypothetical protein
MTFQAQSQLDLATVEKRLAEVEAELHSVESGAPAAALRNALGHGSDEDTALVASLPVLRAELDSLRLAREAAQQLEADRVAAAKNRETASACRAATQHLARCEKELLAAAAASEAATRSYNRACEAARSAMALLPRPIRVQAYAEIVLSPKRLRRHLLLELTRHGRDVGESIIADFGRGSFVRDVEVNGVIPPTANLIARDFAGLRDDLRNILHKVSPAGDPFPPADEAAALDTSRSDAAAPIPEEAAA